MILRNKCCLPRNRSNWITFRMIDVDGSLPDLPSVKTYFTRYGNNVKVKEQTRETKRELLVGITKDEPAGQRSTKSHTCPLRAIGQKHHTVGDYRVQVHLHRPEVFGCEIIFTEQSLSVTVGNEVIRTFSQGDLQTWKEPLHKTLSALETVWGVCMTLCSQSGQIKIQAIQSHSQAISRACSCEWKLPVLRMISKLLKPYKNHLLQSSGQTSVSAGPRSTNGNPLSSPRSTSDLQGEDVIAEFCIDPQSDPRVAIFNSCVERIRETYSELGVSCDADMRTVTLQGPARAVRQAREFMCAHIRNLTTERLPLDELKINMLKTPTASVWIQKTINKAKIICDWATEGRSLVSITAPLRDQAKLKHMFQSSFQSTVVCLDDSQKVRLQSDGWTGFLQRLEQDRQGGLAPVLNIKDNTIVMVDLATTIEVIRHTVLAFFHGDACHTHSLESDLTGLQPWQGTLLANANIRQRFLNDLSDEVMFEPHCDSIIIRAPDRLRTECLCRIWTFLATLSQQRINLTPGSMEMYKQAAARRRVCTLLNAEGLVCHWRVKVSHIEVNALESDQQELRQIFTSAFKEVRIPVPKAKSHLLGSQEFLKRVSTIRQSQNESPVPVVRPARRASRVVIVDTPEHCARARRSVVEFFDTHNAPPSSSE
ncbi:uncharacterized protein [Littorina saxatilis]|uniref:uncharacterized protein n=1 Tax=Littorina saxatilis TaxID=31220 RepID=UPI0038B5707D